MTRRYMRLTPILIASTIVVAGAVVPATAQVKHIQAAGAGGIASAVWAGDTLYVSGQLPTPTTPGDREKGTAPVYGNTEVQAENVFSKIQGVLKEQGLGRGDTVMMRVYMAADPKDGKADTAGMNAAYAKFFGTADQPNKPARATVVVAALVAQGASLEVEAQAVRGK